MIVLLRWLRLLLLWCLRLLVLLLPSLCVEGDKLDRVGHGVLL